MVARIHLKVGSRGGGHELKCWWLKDIRLNVQEPVPTWSILRKESEMKLCSILEIF